MKVLRNFLTLTIFISWNALVIAQYAEGTLVKGSKDQTYIIFSGKACWISSKEIFNLLGFDWKNVKTITDDELNKIPKSALIAKGNGKSVYILQNVAAIKVDNTETLSLLGYTANVARPMAEDRIKKLYQLPLLVKGSGPQIYVLNNGQACWIQSAKIFNALGYDMQYVFSVKDDLLQRLPKSKLLLSGSDNKIYITDKDKRYWISSASTFEKLGYSWKAVLKVEDKFLNRIIEGEPIK